MIRMSIQLDLEKNHERVRGILCGMEAVERELESRGDTVHRLEQEVTSSDKLSIKVE